MSQLQSPQTLAILSCVAHQADASIAEISKHTGLRDHKIRYCLSNLRDRGIISPALQINPYTLGYTEYYIFFTVENSSSARSRIVQTLCSTPEVFWVGELGTAFQFGASILSKGVHELVAILQRISQRAGGAIIERTVATCYSLYTAVSHVLSEKKVPIPFLWYGDDGKRVEIDEVDHAILRALSLNPFKSYGQLGREIGRPASTVDYRVKAMRKSGVIVGLEYRIDYSVLGLTSFPAMLYLRQTTPEVHQKLLQFCLRSPFVSYYASLIGRWDSELGVKIRDPRELSTVSEQLNDLLGPALARVEFYTDIKCHKLEAYPFHAFPRPKGPIKAR